MHLWPNFGSTLGSTLGQLWSNFGLNFGAHMLGAKLDPDFGDPDFEPKFEVTIWAPTLGPKVWDLGQDLRASFLTMARPLPMGHGPLRLTKQWSWPGNGQESSAMSHEPRAKRVPSSTNYFMSYELLS